MSPIIRELISIRRERGLSRIAVATTAGFTESALTKWELNKNLPTIENVEAWAGALGFELDLHLIQNKATANVR